MKILFLLLALNIKEWSAIDNKRKKKLLALIKYILKMDSGPGRCATKQSYRFANEFTRFLENELKLLLMTLTTRNYNV